MAVILSADYLNLFPVCLDRYSGSNLKLKTMENLEIYNKVRSVPDNAKKPIQAGRLSGKTDINPMWRIKVLTETFGPCGFGWKYEIVKMWNEAGAEGEVASFMQINLYVKVDGEWSEPIPGIGGNSFVTKERNGFYTSDENLKMCLTDAISVACKALGIAADVYWDQDSTKYDRPQQAAQPQPASPVPQPRKKALTREMFNEIPLLAWIYKNELKSREQNKRFSVHSLVEASYAVSKEDLNEICANYEQYKINNNL